MGKFHLFERFGIELEYMIVDRDSLKVRPIADELIKKVAGEYTSDIDRWPIAWSNELVNHVVELKTNGPTEDLRDLSNQFHNQVTEINQLLEEWNAMLLPTGAHPMMDPMTETQLWPHEYNEIYALYNRIFDCRGHGWSNLQSMHINLPFFDDKEFERLHAAIRILLPIIPALAASTPILDNTISEFTDARLVEYQKNQKKIPITAGKVIPEALFTEADYNTQIFAPIREAYRPYDTEGILDHYFLNSRGAIARFDRGAIEIRVIDLQESPKADILMAKIITGALSLICLERWTPVSEQKQLDTDELKSIFDACVSEGHSAKIINASYLRQFGVTNDSISAQELWLLLLASAAPTITAQSVMDAKKLIERGTLSSAIVNKIEEGNSIEQVYQELAKCLQENTLFGL